MSPVSLPRAAQTHQPFDAFLHVCTNTQAKPANALAMQYQHDALCNVRSTMVTAHILCEELRDNTSPSARADTIWTFFRVPLCAVGYQAVVKMKHVEVPVLCTAWLTTECHAQMRRQGMTALKPASSAEACHPAPNLPCGKQILHHCSVGAEIAHKTKTARATKKTKSKSSTVTKMKQSLLKQTDRRQRTKNSKKQRKGVRRSHAQSRDPLTN